jgi:recombination protein RecA
MVGLGNYRVRIVLDLVLDPDPDPGELVTRYIRTGSIGLDVLLGGGWVRGHIHEIWGEPGSGKSTVAETALHELERGEQAMWMILGTELPRRPSTALVCQPRNAELAFCIMETFLGGRGALVVVDSANGLVRQAELDGDPGYTPHPQREYAAELNGLKKVCADHGGTVVFLSKPRDHDRQPIRGTGISEKARSRVRLHVKQVHQDESRLVEATVRGIDGASALFPILPGTGIDWASELASMALKTGIATRKGSWIDLNPLGFHGLKEFAREIEDNVRLAVELDERIRERPNPT